MNDNVEIQNEEEIDLLDLFAVLLRYRKFIAGITLASIALVIAGYFIYLPIKYKNAITGVQSQGIMQMEIVSKAQAYVSQYLEGFILRPDIIYDSLYTAGMKTFSYNSGTLVSGTIALNNEKKNIVMYLINLFWIQNLDLNGNIYIPAGKEYNKVFDVRRTAGGGSVVEVTLKDKDPAIIKRFLESIFKLSTINVEKNLRTNAKLMVDNYERLMNLPQVSESVQLMLERDFETYTYLKNFLEGKESVVRLIGEPVFVEIMASEPVFKKQYIKTGLIIIFTGFFLSIMLAFLLNFIHNIKNDKESMKRIDDALGHSSDR